MLSEEKKQNVRTKPHAAKNRILEQAEVLFLKFGFSKVTLDEIARELGMSKKTIYLHFADKKAIMKQVVRKLQQQVLAEIDVMLYDSGRDFIYKLQTILGILKRYISVLLPYIINDLKRHYPEMWLQIHEFRQKESLKRIHILIQEGIQKGIIRNDIPTPLLTTIYFNIIENIIISEKSPDIPFSQQELFEAGIKLILNGILTDEAQKKIIFF